MAGSDFDAMFAETALPAFDAVFAGLCDYKPAIGEDVSKSDVPVTRTEGEEDHGAPVPGKGRLSSMSRIWRCQTALLTPKRGGIFVDGEDSYRVEEKPIEDNGEWVFAVVKI